MKIDKNYLETLIRDSERLRIIESLLESPDVYVTDAIIRAVTGIVPEELEIPDIEELGGFPFVDVPEKGQSKENECLND